MTTTDVIGLLALGQEQASLTAGKTPVSLTITLDLTADDAVLIAIAIDRVLAARSRPPGDATDRVGQRLAAHRDHLREAAQTREDDAPARPISEHGNEIGGVLYPCPSQAFVSPSTFASLRGITPRTVTNWCRSGQIPGAHQIDGRWQIPADAEPEVPR